jgi:hypothetical protein
MKKWKDTTYKIRLRWEVNIKIDLQMNQERGWKILIWLRIDMSGGLL